MKTLTANQLALYLGCEAEKQYNKGTVKIEPITPLTIYVSANADRYNVKSIKPILRPLSDITEEEYSDAADIFFDKSAGYKHISERHAARFYYLLSKGFDLFNWIDQGLAIDKTAKGIEAGAKQGV